MPKQQQSTEQALQPWEAAAEADVPATTAAAPVVYSDDPHSILEADDAYLPRLRLAQGLTPEVQDGVAKPGQWIIVGFDPLDTVTVVPIRVAKVRVRTGDEGEVLCQAPDGKVGIGDPGGECDKCPLRHWSTLPDGSRVPPECDVQFRYVVYVMELGIYAVLVLRRTGMQAAKTINTIILARGLGNVAIRLTSASQKSRRGSYHIPAVAPVVVSEDILAQARAGIDTSAE